MKVGNEWARECAQACVIRFIQFAVWLAAGRRLWSCHFIVDKIITHNCDYLRVQGAQRAMATVRGATRMHIAFKWISSIERANCQLIALTVARHLCTNWSVVHVWYASREGERGGDRMGAKKYEANPSRGLLNAVLNERLCEVRLRVDDAIITIWHCCRRYGRVRPARIACKIMFCHSNTLPSSFVWAVLVRTPNGRRVKSYTYARTHC